MYKQNLLFLAIFVMHFTLSAQIKNGYDVIKKMKTNYSNKWYTNLTFKQNTFFYENDTLKKKEIWFEAMTLGKGLIIKFKSKNSGNGYLFKNDSMSVYKNNTLISKIKRIHEVLVLGFDVYVNEPNETIQKLVVSGLDFSFFKDTSEHYIIGNPKNKQVWIEKKRLLFSKIVIVTNSGVKSQIEFNKYQRLGGGWIAPEVIFYNNGELILKEEYVNIKTPESLPEELFLRKNFRLIEW